MALLCQLVTMALLCQLVKMALLSQLVTMASLSQLVTMALLSQLVTIALSTHFSLPSRYHLFHFFWILFLFDTFVFYARILHFIVILASISIVCDEKRF